MYTCICICNLIFYVIHIFFYLVSLFIYKRIEIQYFGESHSVSNTITMSSYSNTTSVPTCHLALYDASWNSQSQNASTAKSADTGTVET